MVFKIFISLIGELLIMKLLLVSNINAQEDSLRSALNAMDRRQRDLPEYHSRYSDFDYRYPAERPEDLVFLKADFNNDYLDDPISDQEHAKKRISSSFRERLENDKHSQLEDLVRSYLLNDDTESDYDNDNNDEYEEVMKELWNKYQHENADIKAYLSNQNLAKRYYYPKFGMDSAPDLLKRNRHINREGPNDYLYYMLNYVPNEELFNRLQEERNQENDIINSRYYLNQLHQQPNKRFPVSKRSNLPFLHEEKRSTNINKQTDPKVEKELSNIFGLKNVKKPTNINAKPKANNPKKDTEEPSKVNENSNAKQIKTGITEKIPLAEATPTEKPIQIKKKSIDWSDYFGLDRRKKSDTKSNNINNEWLLERYHKAMSMDSKNTPDSYPLQSFRNHDELVKKEALSINTNNQKDTSTQDERKINEMDSKLKNMEETIIDDALKYTGAHEGETDSKELQQIKDRVISRLAAAYSLEKMRNALGEYKLAMAKEREKMKHQRKPVDDYLMAEAKRTSVPRKQAVDEDRDGTEGDNSIKCTQNVENCVERNYKTPTDIMEKFGNGDCPPIERACNEVGLIIGQYGQLFETTCKMYQMCILCSNNNWFSPTRQCTMLYLEKTLELCKDKEDCKKDSHRSIKYLQDVNQSLLRSQSAFFDECALVCPSSDLPNLR